jgi:hypothetical protein
VISRGIHGNHIFWELVKIGFKKKYLQQNGFLLVFLEITVRYKVDSENIIAGT